jgi:hypothetical protein
MWSKQLFSDIQYELHARLSRLPNVIEYPVPYFCQYSRPEDVECLIKGELSAIGDPYWYLTGARSPEEYAWWGRATCGMAVTRMIIKYFRNKNILLVPLAKDARTHGVYPDKPGGVFPMQYREFSTWIKKYGIRAEIHSRLSLRGIRYALANEKLPIVSVNPNIRGYAKASPNQKGGHLVLVTGYDAKQRVLFLNNPSGFSSLNSQKRHKITENDFRRYYAGRGILVSPI